MARRRARLRRPARSRSSRPGQLAAELGGLQQRQAALDAAADVDGRAVPAVGVGELVEDEVTEVVDVEHVAHLLARAAVADVAQRAARVVREQPVREDALVDLAHLPRAGDHAAAIDHGPDAERVGVLANEQLGREFRRSVERPRALERERLADPGRGRARRRAARRACEARLVLAQREPLLRRDRVHAAGREEDHLRAVAARQLEAVVRADRFVCTT